MGKNKTTTQKSLEREFKELLLKLIKSPQKMEMVKAYAIKLKEEDAQSFKVL
ncbi:MAG: hypothetical protein IJY47_05830 [Clostridia bacterium]|nr:hypothetical protein [Clostridia bacterium]